MESSFTAPADRLRHRLRGLLIAALSARDFSRSVGCATDPGLPAGSNRKLAPKKPTAHAISRSRIAKISPLAKFHSW
jgi:hypothetical protein